MLYLAWNALRFAPVTNETQRFLAKYGATVSEGALGAIATTGNERKEAMGTMREMERKVAVQVNLGKTEEE